MLNINRDVQTTSFLKNLRSTSHLTELVMRSFISALVLMLAAVPAFADINVVPEPESISLIAIGVVGMLLASRRNK